MAVKFRAQYVTEARRRVLSQLIIDKIIRTEGIKAEQEEIDAKIEEQAKSVDKTFEEYKKSIEPRQLEYITNDIIITKLFDFLKANNELVADDGKAEKKPAAKKSAPKKPAEQAGEKDGDTPEKSAEKPAKKTPKKTAEKPTKKEE